MLRKALPNHHDGSVFVFEKVVNKLDVLLAEQDQHEERFTQRMKKIADENEMLQIKLKHKTDEVAKLDKQFVRKEVQTDRDFFRIFMLTKKNHLHLYRINTLN